MIISPYSKLSIGTQIRQILINNSGITNYINNNVFPIQAPEGTVGSFIVYTRNKHNKEYTNFGAYNELCQVLIIIVSDNYDDSISIAELVNDVIEGEHLHTKYNYKFNCQLIDSDEDIIDNKYIQTMNFQIK